MCPRRRSSEVDPFNKKIKTAAGDFRRPFHPDGPHQAGDMAWKAGVIGRTPRASRPAGPASILLPEPEGRSGYLRHRRLGRCRSPLFNFYPKAGHVANAHARIVANYIVRTHQGASRQVRPARTTCAS